MEYPDKQTVMVGDTVLLWPGNAGIVVCSFDDNEYSKEYPFEEWAYLKRGVLVSSQKAGLIHYIGPEPSMQLMSRKG